MILYKSIFLNDESIKLNQVYCSESYFDYFLIAKLEQEIVRHSNLIFLFSINESVIEDEICEWKFQISFSEIMHFVGLAHSIIEYIKSK